MGSCHSEPDDKTRTIDRELKGSHKKQVRVKKLLFLGPGGSGKSTVFKQLVTLHGKGYSDLERKNYVPHIHFNVMQAVKILVEQSEELSVCEVDGVEYDCKISHDNTRFKECIDRSSVDVRVNAEIGESIAALWKDNGIKNVHILRSMFDFPYSGAYLFSRVKEIAKPSYIPSFEDLLHMRNSTTGILETELTFQEQRFLIVDVGGQRSERRKWLNCFEFVTCMIYIAAISEYDQQLYEDEEVNRMEETIDLFEELINNRFFRTTSVIVFLNKADLFREKIKTVPFSKCPVFDTWEGGEPPLDFDQATDYVKELFFGKNEHKQRTIYAHVTTAINTKNIENVFEDVADIVMRSTLANAGILQTT